ncbi:MAG TPA: hypothetical protein VGO26_00255 [Amnibacterium sp.]|nr:hypothetical protein [Amnibacterium sp.]
MTDDTLAEARDLVRRTAAELAAAGARDEALAEYVPARRVLLVDRPARMLPVGRVWRLGVLLLAPDGSLLATGGITRAVEPGHPGHVAASVEDRREHRAAAFRGPFARGETVNYDAVPIRLDAAALREAPGPLLLRDGQVLVRWSASLGDDAAAPFAPYLTERADLLLHPPEGA